MTTDATEQMRSNLDLIGRDDVNDTLEIYSLIGHEEPEGTHTVEDRCAAEFTWDYTKGARPEARQALREGQGRAVERPDRPSLGHRGRPGKLAHDLLRGERRAARSATWTSPAPPSRSGARRSGCTSTWRTRTGRLSQFMHGEQGALMCTAKIVETVPWIDAKYYAATQVIDEARHVEVFSRYLKRSAPGTTR